MEYFLEEGFKIRSDFAYRLGKILLQYEDCNYPEITNYSSTLHISILQSLLTNCIENFKSMDNFEQKQTTLSFKLNTLSNYWGINEEMILKNTYHKKNFTLYRFFSSIRNALSHPTDILINSNVPSTGFTAISENGKIHKYIFVDSPDSDKNEPLFHRDKAKLLEKIKFKKDFDDNCPKTEFVDGFYRITNPRIFKIELTSVELKNLCLHISTYLSQGRNLNWDGKTFNSNILTELKIA
jgi:hypothetical protein